MGIRKRRFMNKLTTAIILFALFFQEGCATPPMQKTQKMVNMSKEQKEKLMLEKLYREGDKAFKQRHHDKGVDIFLKIMAIRPDYRDVQKRLDAFAKAPAQKPAKVKVPAKSTKLSLAQKKEKMALEALYQEGNTALKKRNYDKAIDAFIRILDIRSDYRDVRKKLVKAHQKKGTERPLPVSEKKEVKEEKKDTSPMDEYTINLGDILDISVWQWEDLRAAEVYVRPDGKISFPLAGDVRAVGRTLTEIDQELTQKLTEYIKSPEVSVAIKRFGGKKVIVLGEVGGPGVYAPTGRSSILEVIALSGGFRDTAVTSNVVVIRGNMEKSEAIVCDLRRALKEGDQSEHYHGAERYYFCPEPLYHEHIGFGR